MLTMLAGLRSYSTCQENTWIRQTEIAEGQGARNEIPVAMGEPSLAGVGIWATV